MVWNQLYVGTRNFGNLFAELKKIYQKDEKFQRYIKEDCGTDERQGNYHKRKPYQEPNSSAQNSNQNKADDCYKIRTLVPEGCLQGIGP